MFDAVSDRRLAAIVLGDVVGYSRLMGIDEVGTMTALKAHRNELILPALAAFHGRLIDSQGDTMLIEFGSAVEAVSCAVMVQRKMIARNVEVPEARRIRFRLGINLGDIVIDGEGIYGDGVNVAARLETLCEPGGLCLSRSIEEQVRGKVTFPFADGGEQQLKNISHPIQIFRLPADFIASLPETDLPAGRRKPAPPQTRIAPGTILNGTYQIDQIIGTGGMGEIFKGHEIHSDGLVAIKVIRLEMMHNETALALFQKEARVLKDIHHDAIVRYYIFSFDEKAQRHYLTMEFVDGIALSAMVKQGPLAFEAVSALCKRVASGLREAHERGIIHRDISSDNIIVPQGDVARAKIIDFGIARAADIGGGTIIGGGFAGKYNYVSPEQLGLAGSEVTPRSDIYSFGLVLAEACLGAPIDMGGTQAEVIEKRRTVPDLTGIDARLRPLIEAMLQPDPANRPASMAEVANWQQTMALKTIALAIDGAAPEPLPTPRRQASPTRKPVRHAERWIIGGALAVGLFGVSGFAAYQVLLAPGPARPPIDIPHLPSENQPPTAASPTTGKGETANGPSDIPEPKPSVVSPKPPATDPGEKTDAPTADNDGGPDPEHGPTPPEGTHTSSAKTSVERSLAYLRTYQAKGCFFAQPGTLTESSAPIDGFAQSQQDLDTLNDAFTQTIGFAPDILGHKIWPKQCPALDFMRRVRTDATAPTLFLKGTRAGHDQALVGEVRTVPGAPPRSIAMLQVRDDGTVANISKALKADGTAQTFNLSVTRGTGTGPAPQLLIVVASPHPLDALARSGDMTADQMFKAILDEAARKGEPLSANAKAFLYSG